MSPSLSRRSLFIGATNAQLLAICCAWFGQPSWWVEEPGPRRWHFLAISHAGFCTWENTLPPPSPQHVCLSSNSHRNGLVTDGTRGGRPVGYFWLLPPEFSAVFFTIKKVLLFMETWGGGDRHYCTMLLNEKYISVPNSNVPASGSDPREPFHAQCAFHQSPRQQLLCRAWLIGPLHT